MDFHSPLPSYPRSFLALIALFAASACANEVSSVDPELTCDDLAVVLEGCGFEADRDACLADPDRADSLIDLSCAELEDLSTTADNEVFFNSNPALECSRLGVNGVLRIAVTGSATVASVTGSVTAYAEREGGSWSAGVDASVDLYGDPGAQVQLRGSISYGVRASGDTVGVAVASIPLYPGVFLEGHVQLGVNEQAVVGAEIGVTWSGGFTVGSLASDYTELFAAGWQRDAVRVFFNNVISGLNQITQENRGTASANWSLDWPFPSVAETVAAIEQRIRWIASGGGRCTGW